MKPIIKQAFEAIYNCVNIIHVKYNCNKVFMVLNESL